LATARAIDRLRERCRRRDRMRESDCDTLAAVGSEPSQRAENNELVEQLRIALAQIPPQQSELFCLHSLEGWSYREIADELGISTSRVGVLLHRARAKLARLLGATLGQERTARTSFPQP
jgi:RNA polymerase sigma-70 factor (ECF subfamily)